MAFRLMTGKFGGYWKNEFSSELEITSRYDRLTVLVFLASFLISFILMMILSKVMDVMFYDLAAILAIPFFLLGIMWYYRTRKWYQVIVIVIVTAVVIFYFHLSYMMFYIDVLLVGSIGAASFVTALQRYMFYRILSTVEDMNVKEKMSLWEKTVAFFFNIPRDLDTRNLTMDYNLKRGSIPWGDIKEMILLGLMVGLFLWIYISMNPTFLSIDLNADVPLYLFTIVLYIPVVVMPWSIFKALNVRIETKYRDFQLYSGIKETLKRMVLPMFAAFMYVLIAVNKNNIASVFGFIAMSVGMIILIIVFTAGVYFLYFEGSLVDDIVSKWRVFRPVSLLMSVSEEEKKKDYPGTPVRDTEDFGKLVFKE